VKFIISCSAIKNSFLGILQPEEMCVHLMKIFSIARSIGIFVKSDIASNETETKSSPSVDPLSFLTSWKLLLM